MRRFCLFGTFLLLVAGVFLLWRYRFERSATYPVFDLASLRPTSSLAAGTEWRDQPNGLLIHLKVDDQNRGIVARLPFPGLGPVDFLHVRHSFGAKDLQPGKLIWQDGRGMFEWHSATASGLDEENDPIFSTRHNRVVKLEEFVMRPKHGPAVPVLRIEHLGEAGEMEVSSFEATVLQERLIWKVGRWLLMAGWVIWLYALIHPVQRARRAGALVAAIGWLFMGLYFVVPGPWKSLRPLGIPFSITGESAKLASQVVPAPPVSPPPQVAPAAAVTEPPHAAPAVVVPPSEKIAPVTAAPVINPAALRPLGKIPQNGDFTLTVKLLVDRSKWILHVGFLLVPVFLTACVAGRKPALTLGIVFSLAVEAAQIGFGYGTDVTDLVDLAADAAGILLALAIHWSLADLWFKRRKAPAFFVTT